MCRFAQSAPLPPNQTLYDAAFGDTAFVSVGASGTIYSSVNAGPWELRPSGTTNNLLAVAYGDGTFVAAGANGTLLSSSNGVDWVVRGTNGAWITPKIAYGNGMFIVGAILPGSVWTMLRSTNGVDWQAVNVDAPGPHGLSLPFGGITFGEGRFIAMGGRFNAHLFITSTDGLVWREQGANLPFTADATQGPITYGNGKFAMVVHHYTDDDDGGVSGQVILSDDGISWQNTSFGASDLSALAAGHCSFVVAVSYFSTSPIWFTYGSYRWTSLSLPAAMSVRAIAHGNGRFVAVGSDIIEFQLPTPGHFPISPQVQNLVAGSFTTFFVDPPPCLADPISFQWRKDDIPIPGQTNTYLEFPMVTTNDAGGYSVIAIDHTGLSATSIVAILTVTNYNPESFPPQISYPVTNYAAVVDVGTHTSIHVHATAWPPPAYQWWFEGVPLPGATNEYVVFYNVDHRAVGNYTVVLSNSLGSVTSSVITVTLRTAPPQLSLWYVNHYVLEGDDTPVEFQHNSGLGAPEPNFYVFRDGTNSFLPLGLDGRFLLRDVTPADQGQYMIVASNNAGMSTGLVVNIFVTPAGNLDRWTRRNPLPQNDPLLEVAYGNGRWVAVGERGTVVVSTNGNDWSAHPMKVDLPLTSVTYGNGLFVAAGAGAILTSPDGVTWTARVNRRYYPSYLPRIVLFANGRFVAVAVNHVLTSTDGIDWQEATLPLYVSQYFSAIAYGNGRFVALTQWPDDGPVWTSTDGLNWTASTTGSSTEIIDLAFGNGLFVAVGDDGAVYTSPDGAAWTFRDSDVSNRLIDITFGNGRFVAVGTRGRIISSANGISWRRETSGTPDRLEGVAFAEGLFIAVGENGTILTSPNTTAWTKRNQGVTRDLDGMAVGNGTIVVVGKGGSIVTSMDGVNFTQRASGTPNDLHGVAWADGLFAAVGEPETILTSPDGIAWTLRHSETNSSLKGAAKGNGTWIAVGTGGTLLTSSDGSTWTRRESYTLNDLNSVAYGNGLFVAVGDNLPPNGTLLTSPDGISWTRRNQYIGKTSVPLPSPTTPSSLRATMAS